MADVGTWLKGGLIIDGTGMPPFVGDVEIRGDTITNVVVGTAPSPMSPNVVVCEGLVVVPGFVDIHTHSDVSFLLHPTASSKLMQGVTTEVVGNCGFSPYPVSRQGRASLAGFLHGLGMGDVDLTWSDFDSYACALQACRPIMNVASLVGHGALRIATTGMADVALASEHLAEMRRALHECLDQGAFGLSTGLSYVPSKFAGADEIHELARVLCEHDALYATHARATSNGFEILDEAIDVGRRTGARVQYSHIALNDPRMWGRASDVIRQFEQAVSAGIDLRYDIYPYDASASSLTQYLPAWLQESGEDGLRNILRDRDCFRRAQNELAQGLYGAIPWDWDRVVLSLTGPTDVELEGMTIAVAADARGLEPEELCLRLCARHGNMVQVVLFYRHEDDVTQFLINPLAIVGSDGNAMPPTVHGRPHPRSFGTHARLLQRYVVDINCLPLSEAVHKCTQAATERLGITDRGTIARGMRADLSILDLAETREKATWTKPCQLANGVCDVWVNGVRAVENGAITGQRAGRVLRYRQ